MIPVGDGVEHRLHPMTLVLRAAVSIPALVFLLWPVFTSPDSTAVFNLVLSVLYAVVVLPWVVLHYLRFRYRLTPREIVIHSGVLTRRRRVIPVDRIQTVDIEQQVLHRLTGTARVRIHTAGSQQAEGALDVVSLEEAQRIRAAVRSIQRAEPAAEAPGGDGGSDGSRPASGRGSVLYAMSPGRVVLSGMFRFSLLYIAIIFTFLQYIEPDPEVIALWLRQGRMAALFSAAMESPWIAAAVAVALAMFIGWLSGIVVNLNRYYGFRISMEEGRLHRRHGLLAVREGTIPLRRIQSLILTTNPLMRRFGWYGLEVQTMGIDVREQGHSVAVPFARREEVLDIASRIRAAMPEAAPEPWILPDGLRPVSRRTIRRALTRYLVALLVAAGLIEGLTDGSGWWMLALVPMAAAAAWLRWTCMGYAVEVDHLVVRRGVLRQRTWIIPLGRLQVVHVRASVFQRRLHLRTVYVDTAGASPVRSADVIDLDADDAEALVREVYGRFRRLAA